MPSNPAEVSRVDADARSADAALVSAPAPRPETRAARYRASLRDLPARHWVYTDALGMTKHIRSSGYQVYSFLSSLANRKGVCWPTLDEIAGACQLDRTTVIEARTRLTKAGMVTYRTGTYGRPNRYTILPPNMWRAGSQDQESPEVSSSRPISPCTTEGT